MGQRRDYRTVPRLACRLARIKARYSTMSGPLDYEGLLQLARDEALRDADASFPKSDWRRVDYYRQQVVKRYIDRISPIPYERVVDLDLK
jgi:hypothetical protein